MEKLSLYQLRELAKEYDCEVVTKQFIEDNRRMVREVASLREELARAYATMFMRK